MALKQHTIWHTAGTNWLRPYTRLAPQGEERRSRTCTRTFTEGPAHQWHTEKILRYPSGWFLHARTLWRCASIGSRAGKYGSRAFSRERCGSNGCSHSKRVLCVRTCWLTLSRKCYGRIQIVRLEVWWQRSQESKKETKLSRFVPFKRTGNSQKMAPAGLLFQ